MEPNQSNASFMAPQQPAAQPELMPPAVPTAIQGATSASSLTPSTVAPIAADDADIIEADWVAAVKHTLEQYRHDPYLLSQAMTALRQDYLQKRYGKIVGAAK